MVKVIIPHPEKFLAIKEKFKIGGLDQVHVLSDFDRTLTRSYVNGRRVSALITVLRNEGYLTPEYSAQADALTAKYSPIESDLTISREERKKAMESWWREHYKLLIDSGLTRQEIEKASIDSGVLLRIEAPEFLEFLNVHNIPLVFLSASGLGQESIKIFLARSNHLFKNIHVICNDFVFDKSGRVISVKEPIVHILNKDETLIKDFPCYEEVKTRRNVIVVGDSVDDVDMVVGFDYDNLVKFGFLNEREEESLEKYKEVFDVIITGDGPFTEINEFLKSISA